MRTISKALVSVRDIEEARLVVDLPIGVLDLKEPSRGALGRVGADTVNAIVRMVRKRRADLPVSATTGDLNADALPDLVACIAELDAGGVDYIKLGFFSHDDFARIPAQIKNIRMRSGLVGVLFADRINDLEGPCHLLRKAGFAGVMVDTADKSSGSITRRLTEQQLENFVGTARSLGLLCGIAGSLSDADIPALMERDADYLGFRSACCAQDRNGAIDPAKVRALAAHFGKTAASPVAAAV